MRFKAASLYGPLRDDPNALFLPAQAGYEHDATVSSLRHRRRSRCEKEYRSSLVSDGHATVRRMRWQVNDRGLLRSLSFAKDESVLQWQRFDSAHGY